MPRKPRSTKISEETLLEPEEKVEPRKPHSGKATEEASKPGKTMKRPQSEASTSAQPEQAEETEPPQKKSQKREEDMSAKELVTHWNRTAQIRKPLVTTQGWLKKTERRRDAQNQLLQRAKPGM